MKKKCFAILRKREQVRLKLPKTKAIITDYIGTLISPRNYSMETSVATLHSALVEAGFKADKADFLKAYAVAHEKYRVIRYEQLREVTNAVWVAEALNILGYKVDCKDLHVKEALNVFFQDYVDSFELRPYVKQLLSHAAEKYKLGLISNFTYAPAVYASLRKLDINKFFGAVVVSENNGWRKPHKQIFQDALQKLQVKAEEAIYIGDSPNEDIKGAGAVGMKTVFVCSQFYSLQDLCNAKTKPDVTTADVKEIYENFTKIAGLT